MNLAIGVEVPGASGPFGIHFIKRQFGQVPSCATRCLLDEDPSGFCAVDPQCLCTDRDFLSSIACCIIDACDAEDRDATNAYALNYCGSLNIDVSKDIVCPTALPTAGGTKTTSSPSTSIITTSTRQSSTDAFSTPDDSSTDDQVDAPQESDSSGGNTSLPSSTGGLSRNTTIGLGVGIGVAAILLLALAVWILLRRRRRKQQNLPVQETAIPAPHADGSGVPRTQMYEMDISKGLEPKITTHTLPSEDTQSPQFNAHGYEMHATPKPTTNTTGAVSIRNDSNLPEMSAVVALGRGPELPGTPFPHDAVMTGHTAGSVPSPELPASPPPQYLYATGRAPDSRTDPHLSEMPSSPGPVRELPASPVPEAIYSASRVDDPRLDPHLPELQENVGSAGSPVTYRQDLGAEQESAMLRQRQTQIAEERERLLRLARLEEEESEIRRRLNELER